MLFFFSTCERCVEIYWFRSNVKPSLNLSLFLFIAKWRINILSVWQRQLYFPSQSSLLSRSLFCTPSSLLSLPPCESGSILLFRSLLAAEKARQMWQIWSYVKIAPTRQRFSTWSISDPVSLSEPKTGLFSLLFFFFFFLFFSSPQTVFKAQALKSTLSLIQ